MTNILTALLDAIHDAGTIMTERELYELAYGEYGKTEWVEDAEGNVVDSCRTYTIEGLQEIADIYTNGFNAMNF